MAHWNNVLLPIGIVHPLAIRKLLRYDHMRTIVCLAVAIDA